MLRIRKTLSEIIGPQPGKRLNRRLERAMICETGMKRPLRIRAAL